MIITGGDLGQPLEIRLQTEREKEFFKRMVGDAWLANEMCDVKYDAHYQYNLFLVSMNRNVIHVAGGCANDESF